MPSSEFEPLTDSVYFSLYSPLLSIVQYYATFRVGSWHTSPLEFPFSERKFLLQLHTIPLQFCACFLFPHLTRFSPNSCRVPHVLRTPGTQRKRCSNLAVIKWNISCLTAANCCGGRRIVSPQCTLICSLHLASCCSLVCSSRNRRQAPAHTVSPKIAFWTNISIFACDLLWSTKIPNVRCNCIEWLHATHTVIIICHNNNDNTAN